MIDADAFWYSYTNDQVPLGVANSSLTLTEFLNIPTAVSDGIELTADWRPIRHLDLNVTYGFDHTTITSGCASVGGVATGACYEDALDPFATAPGARPVGGATSAGTFLQAVKGDALPQAPENKVAFNVNYTWEFEPGNLTASATYSWRDKSYASIFTRTYDMAPSWSQVDLRVVWSGDHDRYEIIGFVRNLFDTLGYDAAAGGYIAGGEAAAMTQVPAFDPSSRRAPYGVELRTTSSRPRRGQPPSALRPVLPPEGETRRSPRASRPPPCGRGDPSREWRRLPAPHRPEKAHRRGWINRRGPYTGRMDAITDASSDGVRRAEFRPGPGGPGPGGPPGRGG